MSTPPEVLVVSCHPEHCKPLIVSLARMNLRVAAVFSARDAMQVLGGVEVPVVCCCAELPDGNYRTLLQEIAARKLKTRLVVVTAAEECAEYLEGMQLGAFDFLPAPYQKGEIERIVGNALRPSELNVAVGAETKAS